jgi:phosphoglycerol transferase MdoB-like AlkP superfamily enzyme/tetratricopeptide (TPR) repeat protein
MKKNIDKLKHYLYLFFPLFVIFFLFSVVEILLAIGQYKISFLELCFFKATNDFWATVAIAIVFFPLYFVVGFLGANIQRKLFLSLFGLVIIGQFMLVKYSLTTLVNLGADILGYSLEEMVFTVKASKEISPLEFLPCLFLLLLFFEIYYVSIKKIDFKIMSVAFVALFIYHGIGVLYFEEIKEEKFQNKTSYFIKDIVSFKLNEFKMNSLSFESRDDYPYLKSANEIEDVLTPFLNLDKEKKPNIVVVIVEGLGTEFIGTNNYSGFMPYVDSLIDKSLYWENFLANTGRTFGVLPSLLGSLPMGQKGFLENDKLPDHKSLFNLLRYNDYQTSYFSGDKSSFDKKNKFLDYNKVDIVVDENLYGEEYTLSPSNDGGFSWGYPDMEIFKKTLATMDVNKQPRLDVIMTLSNHEPFNFPNKELYYAKVDSIVKNKKLRLTKEEIDTYKDIFATLVYTDESISFFMEEFKKREDYKNTIFVITGDHRLIPINQKDKLCRFHVPLLITSPMLKRLVSFKSVSSHWDVAPSIVSLLDNYYGLKKSEKFAWLGKGLDTVVSFRNRNQIPLMRYKGSINDFFYQEYLLSDDVLYRVKENFGIYKIDNDSIKAIVSSELNAFKSQNSYVSQENKIIPPGLRIYTRRVSKIDKEQRKLILKETKNMTFDAVFFAARDSAFNKNYNKALLLCDYVLEEYPGYVDAQILKGRIYAWSGVYKKAEENLLNVLLKSPYYDDTYLALLDLYWWSNQEDKSILLVKDAMDKKIKNPEMPFKLAKAYERMGNKSRAIQIMDSIIVSHPDSLRYINYKRLLK